MRGDDGWGHEARRVSRSARIEARRGSQFPAPTGTSSKARLDEAGAAAPALWEERGTPAENPLRNAGLRAGPRLLKTGVAALGEYLDGRRDQLLP